MLGGNRMWQEGRGRTAKPVSDGITKEKGEKKLLCAY